MPKHRMQNSSIDFAHSIDVLLHACQLDNRLPDTWPSVQTEPFDLHETNFQFVEISKSILDSIVRISIDEFYWICDIDLAIIRILDQILAKLIDRPQSCVARTLDREKFCLWIFSFYRFSSYIVSVEQLYYCANNSQIENRFWYTDFQPLAIVSHNFYHLFLNKWTNLKQIILTVPNGEKGPKMYDSKANW